MSEAKRAELIADGKLNADGSRKRTCPTCGHELTEEEYVAVLGSGPGDAVATPEPHEAGQVDPSQEAAQ